MWSQPRQSQSPGFAAPGGIVRLPARASAARSQTSAVGRGYAFPNTVQTVNWNSPTHHGQPCCPGPGTRSQVRSCASLTHGPLFDPLGISWQPTRTLRAARVRSFGVFGMRCPPWRGRVRVVRLWLIGLVGEGGEEFGGYWDGTVIALRANACRWIGRTLAGERPADWRRTIVAFSWHLFAHEVAHSQGFDHGEKTVGADCRGWRIMRPLMRAAEISRGYAYVLWVSSAHRASCPSSAP